MTNQYWKCKHPTSYQDTQENTILVLHQLPVPFSIIILARMTGWDLRLDTLIIADTPAIQELSRQQGPKSVPRQNKRQYHQI